MIRTSATGTNTETAETDVKSVADAGPLFDMKEVGRFLLVLSFTAIVTLFYWYLYGKPLIGIDDSNIYFAYAKNLMEGRGFTYSAGSGPVEGFTSMFWMLVISPFYLLGKYFETAILVLDMLIVSWCLFASINFLNRLTNNTLFLSAPALLFLVIITVIPGYFDWTVLTLMETGFWSLLITLITILLCGEKFSLRETKHLAILLALLLLTRPESLLWSIVFVCMGFVRLYLKNGNVGEALKTSLIPLASIVVTIGVLTIFRMVYFGFPLPNTYYAKVSTDMVYNVKEGVRYFLFSAIQSPLMLFFLFAWTVSLALIFFRPFPSTWEELRAKLTWPSQAQLILVSVGFISVFIPVYLGGDHFKLLRFFQPFMIVYLLSVFNLSFWRQFIRVNTSFPMSTGLRFLLIAGLTPFIYLLTDSPLHTFIKLKSPIDGEFRLAELGRDEAVKMNNLFASMEELPSVGVSAAGGFGYMYEGPVIDLMGLNNVTMAHALKEKVGMKNHAAFDKNVFHEQKPAIFHGYKKISSFVVSPRDTSLLENEAGFQEMHVFRLYKKLFADARFQREYAPVIITNPEGTLHLKTYCRRDYAEALARNNFSILEIPRTTRAQN